MKTQMICMAIALAAVTTGAFAQSNEGKGSPCKADVQEYCKGVQPGGGRIRKCMAEHKDDLSDGCKAFLKEKREQRKNKGGGNSGSDDGQKSEDDS